MLKQSSKERATVDDLMCLPQVNLRIRERKVGEQLARIKRKEEDVALRESRVTSREEAVREKEEALAAKEKALNELMAKVQELAVQQRHSQSVQGTATKESLTLSLLKLSSTNANSSCGGQELKESSFSD